jgi:hypothetical protein
VSAASSKHPVLLCYDGSESAARAIRAAGTQCSPRSAVVVNLWESWVTAAPVLAGVARPVNAMTDELDKIATGLSEVSAARCSSGEWPPVNSSAAGSPLLFPFSVRFVWDWFDARALGRLDVAAARPQSPPTSSGSGPMRDG